MILSLFITSTLQFPFEIEPIYIQKLAFCYLFVLVLFIYFCVRFVASKFACWVRRMRSPIFTKRLH